MSSIFWTVIKSPAARTAELSNFGASSWMRKSPRIILHQARVFQQQEDPVNGVRMNFIGKDSELGITVNTRSRHLFSIPGHRHDRVVISGSQVHAGSAHYQSLDVSFDVRVDEPGMRSARQQLYLLVGLTVIWRQRKSGRNRDRDRSSFRVFALCGGSSHY